jgi:hypothetical protein
MAVKVQVIFYYYSVRFFGRSACKDACPSGKPLFFKGLLETSWLQLQAFDVLTDAINPEIAIS